MHFGFGSFGMILFWIAIVALIVVVVKMLSDSSPQSSRSSKTPQQILETRYAAGEISREEFEEKKRDLAQR